VCKEKLWKYQGSGREVALLPRRSSTYFEKPKAREIAKFKGSHVYSITFNHFFDGFYKSYIMGEP
jgi:hypothetical protein